ncbi:MAG TPA: plastocyanin/azurin family copper-binding protein [Candidatus Polarisedimenticolia bacterium]|nr:plastocyanin/azurin family copper-binding protein [Candidatus Polarisedimenticolia bacterium]
MRTFKLACWIACHLMLSFCVSVGAVVAVEPGVDIAVPRVAVSQVGDALLFQPASLVVEQGDWVLWKHVGTSLTHTTTSGAACAASGLWSATLGPGTQFMRQFQEAPQGFPFFCMPHCSFGMTGQVKVTSPISLQVADDPGAPNLSWAGGGGIYRVYRSDAPGFTGGGTVSLAPDGGNAGTSFTDTTDPPAGGALFYLVMNKF